MYLQCQNHSLPSNYNHCRLDVFEKLEQLAFFFFLVLNEQLAIVQFKFFDTSGMWLCMMQISHI